MRNKPVVANADTHVKWYTNIEHRCHGAAHKLTNCIRFFAWHIKQQFVVDL